MMCGQAKLEDGETGHSTSSKNTSVIRIVVVRQYHNCLLLFVIYGPVEWSWRRGCLNLDCVVYKATAPCPC